MRKLIGLAAGAALVAAASSPAFAGNHGYKPTPPWYPMHPEQFSWLQGVQSPTQEPFFKDHRYTYDVKNNDQKNQVVTFYDGKRYWTVKGLH